VVIDDVYWGGLNPLNIPSEKLSCLLNLADLQSGQTEGGSVKQVEQSDYLSLLGLCFASEGSFCLNARGWAVLSFRGKISEALKVPDWVLRKIFTFFSETIQYIDLDDLSEECRPLLSTIDEILYGDRLPSSNDVHAAFLFYIEEGGFSDDGEDL